jgi:hypothetical protein
VNGHDDEADAVIRHRYWQPLERWCLLALILGEETVCLGLNEPSKTLGYPLFTCVINL